MATETRIHDKLLCRVCARGAAKQCPKCKVPYCSKECQAKDWKDVHKGECAELTKAYETREAEKRQLEKKKKKTAAADKLPEFIADEARLLKELKLGDAKQTGGKQKSGGGGGGQGSAPMKSRKQGAR